MQHHRLARQFRWVVVVVGVHALSGITARRYKHTVQRTKCQGHQRLITLQRSLADASDARRTRSAGEHQSRGGAGRFRGRRKTETIAPKRGSSLHGAVRNMASRRARTLEGAVSLQEVDRRIFGLENEYEYRTLRGQRDCPYEFPLPVPTGLIVGSFVEVFIETAPAILDVGSHPEYATPSATPSRTWWPMTRNGERILESLGIREQRLEKRGYEARSNFQEQHGLRRQCLRAGRTPGEPHKEFTRPSTCDYPSWSLVRSHRAGSCCRPRAERPTEATRRAIGKGFLRTNRSRRSSTP